MQIMSNLPDPSVASYPTLSYALRGLRRRSGTAHRKQHSVWDSLDLCTWANYLKEFASDMLTPQDVAVDSHTTQSNIVIHVKHSKK